METNSQISEFGKIFIFLIIGVLFVLAGYAVNKLLRKDKPNPEKNSSYECGEEPIGNAHIQFNPRFYVIALVFLLFEIEIVFLFPWATVFADKQLIAAAPAWGWLSLLEMLVFVGILLLGLVYVWVKKDLDWIKPQPIVSSVAVSIPINLYEALNQRSYTIKAFESEKEKEKQNEKENEGAGAPTPAPIKKPMFKPGMAVKNVESENESGKQNENEGATAPTPTPIKKPAFKPGMAKKKE